MQWPTGLIIGGVHYSFTVPDEGGRAAKVLDCEGAGHVLTRLGGLRHGARNYSSKGGEYSAFGVNFNNAPGGEGQAGIVTVHA